MARDTPWLYSLCTPHWGQKWHVGINEDAALCDSKWERWLRAVTHEDSVRGIARATGRSHTTVQRWVAKGVPPPTVWELTLRFRGDPIAALVVLGRIAPEQVGQINFAAVVKYADADVLTAELHSRAMRERVKRERSDAFDGTPFEYINKV